jgi:hypothetical protein
MFFSILIALAALISLPSAFMMTYFAWKALTNLKPGVKLYDAPLASPLNHLWVPGNFNDVGLTARRRYLYAFLGCFGPILLVIAIGLAARLFT